MPFVIVTGTAGAGKTTLVERIRGYKKTKVVNVASIMEEIAERKGYSTSRDRLRYMSRKRQQEVQRLAFKKVSSISGNVVIDTHAAIKAGSMYFPGSPFTFLDSLRGLAGFVHIDANSSDIIKRRAADKSRKREKEDAHQIDNDRIVEISILAAYSSKLNIPFYIIENRQNRPGEAVKVLKAAISDLFGV